MKVVLLIALISLGCFAQNNGDRLLFASTFNNTDSVRVNGSAITDTIFTGDTLYTGVFENEDKKGGYLQFFGEWVKVSSGTIDSLNVQVRFMDPLNPPTGRKSGGYAGTVNQNTEFGHRFTPWYQVLTNKSSDVLHTIHISYFDSTWYVPTAGIQYRQFFLDTSTDTLIHKHSTRRD